MRPPGCGRPAVGELTEAQLEALLFVAEKPLSRAEIARLAGVDRETVDERLGDLEVVAGGPRDPPGPRPATAWSSRRRPRRGPRSPATSARMRSGSRPAALETLAIVAYRQPITKAGDRAHPRRGLRLHGPRAAAPPPGRRAGSLRGAGPSDPLRHRLRVPRAVRAHEPRGAADAGPRRRGPAGGRHARGRIRRDRQRDALAGPPRRPATRRAPERDAGRADLQGAGRGRRRLPSRRGRAGGGRARDRGRAPRGARRAGGPATPSG